MSEKKDKIIVGIADIHFGAFDAETLYTELHECFIKQLKKLDSIDLIVISGDLFHNKLSFNSSSAKYSIEFFKELNEICIEKNAKLRVVKGTHSHDNNQLDTISLYVNNIDYKLFNKVDTETFEDGTTILYLPEEYIENMDEYYADYFNKTYDIICGHGMIDTVSFLGMTQESETTMSKCPIFKSDKLVEICKGPIIFGHIHKHQVIKKRIFYTGSFSRWSFGEEEDKGFALFRYNPNNGDLSFDFIKNTLIRTYHTIELTVAEEMAKMDVYNQIDTILDVVKRCHSDFIRVKLILPSFIENSKLLTDLITETFAKFKKVTLQVINLSNLSKDEQTKQKVNFLLEKYGFLFENSISFAEKISKFIKIKYNKNISLEEIEERIGELK